MMEWRKSTVPNYEVSESGDMKLLVNKNNIVAGTILKGHVKKGRGGYRIYHIRVGGKTVTVPAHREVLMAFVGPPPTEEHQCAHYDGDPTNNHFTNLRWATAAENTADKVRHGRHLDGHRRFTKEQVLEMRAMRENGKTFKQIREVFKISKGNLSSIINRKTWGHLEATKFNCTKCGKCCVDSLYMGTLSACEEDLARWEDAERYDILDTAYIFYWGDHRTADLWMDPKTGDENISDTCPWVKKIGEDLWHCSIHELRPNVCRDYPVDEEQAEGFGCPGYRALSVRSSSLGPDGDHG